MGGRGTNDDDVSVQGGSIATRCYRMIAHTALMCFIKLHQTVIAFNWNLKF